MKILYEDDEILAIEKPCRMMVHTDGRSDEPTVVDWICENYPELEEVGEPQTLQSGEVIRRPGIVHRLDRETSGVLLIAKTQEAFLHLKDQFKNHTIHKTYRAFVRGVVKEEALTIDKPIGRSARDFRLRSAQRGARGRMREAVTDVRVLARGKQATYVDISPRTGRTHQIRVHLKAIHHPVLGDHLYGPKDFLSEKFGRLALHAYSIVFRKLSGEEVAVTSHVPASFESFLTSDAF